MKIKITLIAFFASALFLTSCMKNEVSPGIEEVRSAYAELLRAKASATITAANAQAVLTNAQAQVQLAIAAMNEATANKTEAEADRLREQLAYDMQVWALQLDSVAAEMDKAIAALQEQIQDAKDAQVKEYLKAYIDALTDLKDAQALVATQLNHVATLELDLQYGKTNGITNAEADLVTKEAALAALLAELEVAQGLVGDAAGIAARIVELENLITQNEALELAKLAAAAEIETDSDVDSAAYAALKVKSDAKAGTLAAAKAKLDTSLAAFEAEWPVPAFWQEAKDSVVNTKARRDAYDTTTAYNAWQAQQDIIDDGTTDIDAEIADTIQAIADYNDTIDLYETDSATKYAAFQADSTVSADLRKDTADWQDIVDLAHDSATAQRLRLPAAEAQTALALSVADSSLYAAKITVAKLVDIPAADTDSAASWAVYNLADLGLDGIRTTYNGLITAAETKLGSSTTTVSNATGTLYEQRNHILGLIANAEATVDDLETEYLHKLSFYDELQAAYEAALAYKEDVRPDYEEYMDAFYYDEYVPALEAAVAAAQEAYDAAKELTDDAKAKYDETEKPHKDLLAEAADAADAAALYAVIKAAYVNADTYNNTLIGNLNTQITNAEGAVELAKKAILDAENTYADAEVDYAHAEEVLAELQAKVDAAQAAVDYWKALLDEALAN